MPGTGAVSLWIYSSNDPPQHATLGVAENCVFSMKCALRRAFSAPARDTMFGAAVFSSHKLSNLGQAVPDQHHGLVGQKHEGGEPFHQADAAYTLDFPPTTP